MGYAKGKVDAISIKERKSGQHGDFANFGIKLNTDSGEQWFNGTCNADKYTNELVVKDKNHNKVEVGMTIEFMTVTNGNYENIDRKTMMILSSGSATPQPTEQQAPNITQKPVEQRSAPQVDNDAIIRSNCLVAAAIKAHGSLSQEDYKKLDMDMLYRAADSYMDYCKNGRK